MAKSTNKNRKYERNKVSCAAYRTRCQREKNALKRITRHLLKHSMDKCAIVALRETEKFLSLRKFA